MCQYKDHLGNIRLAYSDYNDDNTIDIDASNGYQSEIVEEHNFYPFGLKQQGYNNVIIGEHHPYGFGGKEEQSEFSMDWIDITARNYDPAIGGWMNIDPLAEQMRRHSPYNYAFNNPIFFTDTDGMAPEDWVSKNGGKNYYWDANITSEKAGVKYGGKTIRKVIKKEDSPWIWNQFESQPSFDLKNYYEEPVKKSI
ncbi:RHS repeat domain-containing protein [Pontimicrobium sp. MEBiC06410]